jgi:IS5 family transposase
LRSFKVFRCQLPKDNPYYEAKSDDAIEEDPEAAQYIYHMPEKGTTRHTHTLHARAHTHAHNTHVLSRDVTSVFLC